LLTKTQTRTTKQRKIILDELCKVKTHPTVDEVYDIVRKRLPRISLGTIYRNLEMLAEQGKIKKLEIDNQRMRFDGNTDAHSHIRCIICSSVDDIEIEPKVIWEEDSLESGYQILGNKVEFFGKCPKCRMREPE
jgi:Fur family ferric uptake transcriptional regulator